MTGQVMSLYNKKYNVIILAGGLGTRMGIASDYIPKALSKFGTKRAIDLIIERYTHVAHKFIIGTGYHADLLETYVKGQYQNLHIPISFSYERPEDLKNAGVSTMYCLDNADSRHGTIICFCDLLVVSNLLLKEDTIYYADKTTTGNTGTFRHSINIDKIYVSQINKHEEPIKVNEGNGILGTFIFSNTSILKQITYSIFNKIEDLTWDIIKTYSETIRMHAEHCDCVYEFGDENNLNEVRKLWENI